jgi:hypothetical protein
LLVFKIFRDASFDVVSTMLVRVMGKHKLVDNVLWLASDRNFYWCPNWLLCRRKISLAFSSGTWNSFNKCPNASFLALGRAQQQFPCFLFMNNYKSPGFTIVMIYKNMQINIKSLPFRINQAKIVITIQNITVPKHFKTCC